MLLVSTSEEKGWGGGRLGERSSSACPGSGCSAPAEPG